MAELIVLGFKNTTTADEAIADLEQMQREKLIVLDDWARAIRREDGKLDVRQASNTAKSGALGGGFWGLLFGLLFLVPVAGLAIGAVIGALSGKLIDLGIDDAFIKNLGEQITPGTSALFLYVAEAKSDQVIERMRKFEPQVLQTTLSLEAQEKLRQELQGA